MQTNDHRHRVAAERRERMRARLLASAMRLVAEKGPAATSIDDVISAAEVSRGTFYKYFPSPDALVRELAIEIANELIGMAEPVVRSYDDPAERVSIEALGHDLFNVRVQYGFMEDPNVPDALAQARAQGLTVDFIDVVYFLGRETIIVTRKKGMAIWREKLFVLMARNAVRATAFFRLPPERVVELGVQVEM